MRASVGDRIIISGHRVGEPERDCEVLEVRGADGAPPYLVRWADSGHETLFFPGVDAAVHHYEGRDSGSTSAPSGSKQGERVWQELSHPGD